LRHDLDFTARQVVDRGNSSVGLNLARATLTEDQGTVVRPTYLFTDGTPNFSRLDFSGLPSDGSCFAASPGSAFTVVIEMQNTSRDGVISAYVAGGTAAGNDAWSIAKLNTDAIAVFHSPDGAALQLLVTSTKIPLGGAPCTIALVKEPAALYAYMNGTRIGKKTAGVTAPANPGTQVTIGGATGGSRNADSNVMRVRMWAGALHDVASDPRMFAEIGAAR
jgi:fermentation-respiration switch protein FrsA (DUF1100 family)